LGVQQADTERQQRASRCHTAHSSSGRPVPWPYRHANNHEGCCGRTVSPPPNMEAVAPGACPSRISRGGSYLRLEVYLTPQTMEVAARLIKPHVCKPEASGRGQP
jgi:hypothetical protein